MMHLNGTEYFTREDYDKVIELVRVRAKKLEFNNMGTLMNWGTLLQVRKMNYLSFERLLNRLNDVVLEKFNSESAMKLERIIGLCLKLRSKVSEFNYTRFVRERPTSMTSDGYTQYEYFLQNCALELILVEFRLYT